MGRIAMTGSGSGIGAATRLRLEKAGNEILGVDLKGQEVDADLATPYGRTAATTPSRRGPGAGGSLDGFVGCAGVGPHVDNPPLIMSVNYFGTAVLLDALRPTLAAALVVGGGDLVQLDDDGAGDPRRTRRRLPGRRRGRGPSPPPTATTPTPAPSWRWPARSAATPPPPSGSARGSGSTRWRPVPPSRRCCRAGSTTRSTAPNPRLDGPDRRLRHPGPDRRGAGVPDVGGRLVRVRDRCGSSTAAPTPSRSTPMPA